MWENRVVIFEDEDEGQLISEFVRLSAKYKDKPVLDLTRYIFRNLPDPETRAMAAANIWPLDIDIQEQIDEARKGFSTAGDLSFEELQRRILAVTESSHYTPQEKKVMIEGYQAYAENKGWRKKAVEVTSNERRMPPQVVSAIGDFHAKPN